MKKALLIGLAVFGLAMIDCHAASAQQATYFGTVANTSCVGSSACTFNFPTVTSANPNGGLGIAKVTCRIVLTTTGPYAADALYAVVSKSVNPSKVEFLSHTVSLLGSSNGMTYYQVVIDANTLYFVQVGASPTVTVNTGTLIGTMQSSTDQPTCSVSGLEQ